MQAPVIPQSDLCALTTTTLHCLLSICMHETHSGEARPPSEVMALLSALDDRSDPEYEKEFLSQAEPYDSGTAYATL
jgi:hypothetical protein